VTAIRVFGIGLLLLVAVVVPGRATAHAVLLRSIPPAGQTLQRAPDQVQLLFSEPIDPAFSSVRVLDSSKQPVDRGDGGVDPNDDHQLSVSLKPGLANGIYTVAWRSLSTIDVHPDEGQYALYIGVPVPTGASATTTSQITATPETTLGRWWFYLAASLFGGVLATWKLVLSGALKDDVRATVRRRAYQLIVLGGVLLVLGTLFMAVAQAAAAAGVPLTEAIGRPLSDLLLRGRFASIWWPRLGLEVVSLLLVAIGGLEGMAAESALATLPAVLLTSSLTSHGAALPSGPAAGIAVDWLHIVGATAWVGGLISLAVLLPVIYRAERSATFRDTPVDDSVTDNARGSSAPAGRAIGRGVVAGGGAAGGPSVAIGGVPRLVARFGRFALAASAIVVLSGVVQAGIEVGSWTGLLDTAYGELVLIKVGLLAAMLGLAVFNDRRGRALHVGANVLRGGVRAELVLGLLALATAAMLTGTPPTRGSL
jgi:copper transport protein